MESSLPRPHGIHLGNSRGFSAQEAKPRDEGWSPPLIFNTYHGDFFDFSVRVVQQTPPYVI
jgi:hypothetical protein